MLFQDQLNRLINIDFPPKRIISLVPSQTELLYDLGVNEKVIGITKFCVHPEKWFRSKTRIGGTKQLKLNLIEQLQPDLIIANKEENDKIQIEYLAERFPVWISDITTFGDALSMIESIGNLVGKSSEAHSIIQTINDKKEAYDYLKPPKLQKVAYFIWRKPYMVAGKDTYINEMLKIYGAENVFEHRSRYPEIQLEDLKKLEIDAVFLSSEPYSFKEKHLEEFRIVCPNAIIILVDGELFSWYGSRMLKTFEYFRTLIS